MDLLVKNGSIWLNGEWKKADLLIEKGKISAIGSDLKANKESFDAGGMRITHGFLDMHTHLREPGFSHKETIRTGTLAAGRGGYTTVCAMPNTKPVPDSVAHIREIAEKVESDALVNVLLYGAITKGEEGQELSDIEGLAPLCAGFSDDGKGVQNEAMMEEAMVRAKAQNRMIVAHCEDESLLHGGSIHEGEFAKRHGLQGISSASESEQVKRDIELVRKTGCAYHICHISAKESLEYVRSAKAEGLPITCEVTPHHAVLCDEDLLLHGDWKMNPPLRGKADLEAIHKALADGTIDVIATDHAPHTMAEKEAGLEQSPFGIVGLETAFGILHHKLVEKGVISLCRLLELLITNPARILGQEGELKVGDEANLVALDLESWWIIRKEDLQSMGKNMPFENWQVKGQVMLTVAKGHVIWETIP